MAQPRYIRNDQAPTLCAGDGRLRGGIWRLARNQPAELLPPMGRIDEQSEINLKIYKEGAF